MSEWFIEDPDSDDPIFLELEEVLFNKVNVELDYSFKGQYFPTYMSVDIWEPTGETRKITINNAPILLHCDNSFQLISFDSQGMIAPNQLVLNDLFVEAQNMKVFDKISSDTYRLLICDYHKLINAHREDNIGNTWIIYREVPNIRKSIDYLISREFIPNM